MNGGIGSRPVKEDDVKREEGWINVKSTLEPGIKVLMGINEGIVKRNKGRRAMGWRNNEHAM